MIYRYFKIIITLENSEMLVNHDEPIPFVVSKSFTRF